MGQSRTLYGVSGLKSTRKCEGAGICASHSVWSQPSVALCLESIQTFIVAVVPLRNSPYATTKVDPSMDRLYFIGAI